MEKFDLYQFRKTNKLTQKAVAEYLGVTPGFISQVESCACKLSDDKIKMLLNNDRGWVSESSRMTDIMKNLYDLQMSALEKGIDFDISLYYNAEKVPTAQVKMNYTVTGSIAKGFVLTTTLSPSNAKLQNKNRIEEIKYFISTVTGPNKD